MQLFENLDCCHGFFRPRFQNLCLGRGVALALYRNPDEAWRRAGFTATSQVKIGNLVRKGKETVKFWMLYQPLAKVARVRGKVLGKVFGVCKN